LFPKPHVVVVLKRVDNCAVDVFHTRGKRAEIEVVPKVPPPPPEHPDTESNPVLVAQTV